ncbi:MAG: sarcosine oxidase subunit gamma [Rhizobiales bacterium]|nr:sarcosine oxidase subunit gamma [Hyphomicrobiales bacterium]
MIDSRRQSPLSHRKPLAARSGEAALCELPFRGFLQLRASPEVAAPAVTTALGLVLPQAVRQTARAGGVTAIWLSPDEWVLTTDPGGVTEAQGALSRALAGRHAQVVDVTDYYTTIEIAGTRARALLAKLVAYDLHPRAFHPGEAVATRIAKVSGWIYCPVDGGGAGNVLHVMVRRSLADYVWCLLADAGREWGLPAEEPRGAVKLHLPHFD